jgi:hypothetical protein
MVGDRSSMIHTEAPAFAIPVGRGLLVENPA